MGVGKVPLVTGWKMDGQDKREPERLGRGWRSPLFGGWWQPNLGQRPREEGLGVSEEEASARLASWTTHSLPLY